MTLTELAQAQTWPFGLILDEADLDQQAVSAARHFAGFGRIRSVDGAMVVSNPTDALFAPYNIPWRGPSDFPGVIYAGLDYGTNPPVVTPPPPAVPDPVTDPSAITELTVITLSEWALIKPLFLLYVERENARALEASRGMGVDVYSRTVSEVQTDIERYENGDMPRLAFSQGVETI